MHTISLSLSLYISLSLSQSQHHQLLPELQKSAEDASFEEIRDVCRTAEQTLLRAMGEAGIAVINANNKNKPAAAASSDEVEFED
jgi:hypothetical protein